MAAHVDTHDAHEEEHHHHKETFVTKYIFSQDHKMIAKQYLITGTDHGCYWYCNVVAFPYANWHGQKSQMYDL